MKHRKKLWMLGFPFLAFCLTLPALPQKPSAQADERPAQTNPTKAQGNARPDIVTAVKDAAEKDCGCGACAAKGCNPCHGKNCYYCVAKAPVAMDCGCKGCDAKGCAMCGPGCDVCKFHLAPVAAAKAGKEKKK